MLSHPEGAKELAEAVRSSARVIVRGGGTKWVGNGDDDRAVIEMAGVSGVVDYQPGEFTFTALAGTRLSEIDQVLSEHGQYLPFDPPWVEGGATLGGTVAMGISGPGRMRYGGVRDFLLGICYVDAQGKLVSGGGKVVKNAAGFDLPKLFCGSLGRFGILAELTFKVFPRPVEYWTLDCQVDGPVEAASLMNRLAGSPFEVDALDYLPRDRVLVRLGGDAGALAARAERLVRAHSVSSEVVERDAELEVWRNAREFAWAEDKGLVKLAIGPRDLVRVDQTLERLGMARRYSVGGNVVWVCLSDDGDVETLDEALQEMKLSGLVVRRGTGKRLIGSDRSGAFRKRVKGALDPRGRFADFA